MLNDVEREIIRATKSPDCQEQQEHGSQCRHFENQQQRGRNANQQKKNAFQPKKAGTLDILHAIDHFRLSDVSVQASADVT